MSLEMFDAILLGLGEYLAFAIVFFGTCFAIGLMGLAGVFIFRFAVLWSIGVIRRRAFYRRDYASNAQGGATTWKL